MSVEEPTVEQGPMSALRVDPVGDGEESHAKATIELTGAPKQWSRLKGAVAIQALLSARKSSCYLSPGKKVPLSSTKTNTDLITAGLDAGRHQPVAPTAEELEAMQELDELEQLIVKADDAGGSRAIIEALVSEILKLKKRVQDLAAELEQDDEEYDEFGQKINPDGKQHINIFQNT